ncbi:MAG TPA: hypothetical protein DEO65_19430 [Bacillus bacterium]|nr:hypothetical protein [Bacillus sp. (in: firmicutes)]
MWGLIAWSGESFNIDIDFFHVHAFFDIFTSYQIFKDNKVVHQKSCLVVFQNDNPMHAFFEI